MQSEKSGVKIDPTLVIQGLITVSVGGTMHICSDFYE